METPEIHLLIQVRWQFFGSLAFKQERLPEGVRLSMLFATLRAAAADISRACPGVCARSGASNSDARISTELNKRAARSGPATDQPR